MTIPSSSAHNARAARRALWATKQNQNVVKSNRAPLNRQPSKKPRRSLKIALIATAVIILLITIFGFKILAAGNKISVAERSFIGQVKDLLFNSGEELKGEADGRINVLLIAVGDDGHSGDNLSDTIMIASIRPEDNKVALLSIPRDLYVQVPGQDFYTKINAIHAFAENRKRDQGPVALREKVEEITDLPIHYYGRVDFTAFKSMIDAVGGVNVTIEKSFYDFWHKISFPAGTEKMNGERSLAYVRARYIEGSEGGDFKRAARQQQVLLALRDKIFSVQTALDFTAINGIINSVADNIRTDMQLWEMRRFYELARLINTEEVNSIVLDTGPNGVLVGGTEVLGGTPASVLYPRTGDFSEIQSIARNIFDDEIGTTLATAPQEPAVLTPSPSPTPTASPTPVTRSQKANVDVRNSTNTVGLAKNTADKIKAAGYTVANVGNATTRNAAHTTVYSTKLEYQTSAQEIANLLNARVSDTVPSSDTTTAGVLVILGQDAN